MNAEGLATYKHVKRIVVLKACNQGRDERVARNGG